MPTVTVDKADLFELLGKQYTTEEFEELCFDFGIELDEDTTNDVQPGERPEYKIDIPANRYDMLCIEGIAQSLNEFLGRKELPNYKLSSSPKYSLTVDQSTESIRPYAAGAILRNITFTERSYQSFISLQDKLHSNLCRNRTLVAIGTHDLDKLEGPFQYKALPKKDIDFIPLNQNQSVTGENFVDFYSKDKNLGKFLHIIEGSDNYPVILDNQNRIASLPPIINSERSKITLDTKNVFIELTATDKTKVEIVVNQLVAMFSRYTSEPFTIEPIEIISKHNDQSRITPNLKPRIINAEIDYINNYLGLKLSGEEISKLLLKMSLVAKVSSNDSNLLEVQIPITRPDILHQADVMEDAAISYGYNNLPKTRITSNTTKGASPLPINKVSDIIRNAAAQSGWSEVLPLTLCSHDENFRFLNQTDDSKAVQLANPKTQEYQVVRTSLIPGILKTIRENRKHSLPIKVFEAGDVVFKDLSLERRAFNQRNWGAIYAGKTSGFEHAQGLLGKIMQTLRTPWLENPKNSNEKGYWIEEDPENKTYFPGRGAKIFYRHRNGEEAKVVGSIGVLHPTVLSNFEIPYAASAVEINAEIFL
ncbi:phenylalanyl-tRNA synthetase beta chain [Wickerhamomyces ciferrii]|uniref:Phenylalanine--tRNA ligase beta subunit n=1 Tax=Wickerhamomyces ciferrii (strain ATCC 14091 / BCRC 22168 / CBS 111 / JCM 3599 / NBRC 0793 / NRRL Y-1031 F-60-10) TaxID=1206466 RepID=K0KRG0_WICCF|nr:phenylalanyl-tRNA synthetase beta chain [Wickerhamomyces ciferrii]CCH43903.1 phenylalanyl-tRNA synthetase beta chain [Wickerhamomyces ciferrii]